MNEISVDLLPKNVESEIVLIGTMLLYGTNYERIMVNIQPDYFALDSHRRIYACIQELAEQNAPYGMMEVNELLCRRHQIESVGGSVYLADITKKVVKGQSMEYHCGILRNKFILRQMMHFGQSIFEASKEEQDSGSNILAYAIEDFLTLQSGAVKKTAMQVKNFSDEVYANIATMSEIKSRLIGFSLGLQPIDHQTTGLRKKEIAVIGGRPGQGKTAWSLQIAVANASKGIPVGIFSLEMDRESLLQRVICSVSEVDFTKVRVPYLRSELEKFAMDRAKDAIDSWPLFVDDDSDSDEGMSLAELRARMRLMKRQHGVELFIVDYLQLIGSSGKDQRERIMRIVRKLRRFAKVEDVAIILLSQMPRPKDHNLDKKPTMFDLLESGEIEQAAHMIFLLYWPLDDNDIPKFEKEIIIAKQRSGNTWNEPVQYVGKYLRYEPR